MEKPLPCFKGYSARSLLSLLDRRFESGYPVGDLTTRVEDPYLEVKANAVDGVCTFAPLDSTMKAFGCHLEVRDPALDATGPLHGADSAKGRRCLPEVRGIHPYRARFPWSGPNNLMQCFLFASVCAFFLPESVAKGSSF